MKKQYKELRKRLKHAYLGGGDSSAVRAWCTQCGIKATKTHASIISYIFGGVNGDSTLPYPHQRTNRAIIMQYLKKHTYREFEDEFFNKPYKKLRKKLTLDVLPLNNNRIVVSSWLADCGIQMTNRHIQMLVKANDGLLYKINPKKIIKYLKKNKEFKV